MRIGLAAVCGCVALLVGCSGASSNSGGGGTPAPSAPTAVAGGPYTGTAGTVVSFSAAGSSDPQGQALTYAWNFGDSSTGSGASATHTYAAAGTYTVSLTVTDTSGLSGTKTTTATLAAALVPPTAVAGGPYTGTVGTAVSFSAAGSSDPQGQTLSYAWNFGDSSTGSGASVTHTYATSGTFTVSLTVTDTSGLTGTAASTSTIGAATMTGAPLAGTVMSGTIPIAGAHVYLFAANTLGYGGSGIAASSSNASVSLLNATLTGASDSTGAYVTTGANGAFSLTGDYACSVGQQLYLYVSGGNAGGGTNSAIGMMAVVGSCQAATASPTTAAVNEFSTVAAAYAMSGFATNATHVSSSGTALAQIGVVNAFASAAKIATLSTGALTSLLVEDDSVDTVADALASCIRSNGSVAGPASPTACYTLFQNSLAAAQSGAAPTETATAVINIAHFPAANPAALYSLIGSAPPYTPVPPFAPTSYLMAVKYNTGTVSGSSLAIDGSGNVWLAGVGSSGTGTYNTVYELSNAGTVLNAGGVSLGAVSAFGSIAIDLTGNAWIANRYSNSVTEVLSTGTQATGSPFTGNGLSGPSGIAIDGSNNVWIANSTGSSVTKLTNTGAAIAGSPFTGGGLSGPGNLAVDGSGNVWAANVTGNSVTELAGTGTPSANSPYTGGGISQPQAIAINSSGDAYITSFSANLLTELSPNGSVLLGNFSLYSPYALSVDGSGNLWYGTACSCSNNFAARLSPAGVNMGGYSTQANAAVAIDGSGNVWELDSSSLYEEIGAAAPVVTPLSVGVKSNMLGARP